MKTHDEMVTEWQDNPAFCNAYEALAEEFALFDALFKARTKAGLTQAEVAGSEAVELSDQQVLDVVIREAKKRREAEEAYANAGRTELAEKEHAESKVLAGYLPQQLTQSEIASIVTDAIASTGAAELGMKGMGKVMAQVTPQTKGRADGSVVAAEVRRQLSG